MKQTANKIASYLLRPFTELLPLLLTLIILTSISAIVPYIKNHIPYSLQLISASALISYGVTFLIGLLSQRLRKIALWGFLVVYLLTAIMSFCSYYFYGTEFNGDLAGVIAGTTHSEASEFIDYLSMGQIIALILGIILLIVSSYLVVKTLDISTMKWRRLLSTMSSVAVVLGIFLAFYKPAVYNNTFVGHIEKCGYLFENIPDLRDYPTHPELTTTAPLPQNIVIIIGESFSKNHSSLYNYQYPTNPRLTALRDSGELLVFNNVTAPYIQTIECFKSIMSTYRREYGDSVNWYQCTTIPEIMNRLGYNTIWLSNQSKKGLYDNIAGRYSDLCNENLFVGNKFTGLSRSYLDEELLKLLTPIHAENNDGTNCYFIHLQGQHISFSSRYPKEMTRFTPADYPQHSEHQRPIIAHYDNATYYNDSIVNDIIHTFKDDEALIFYFSDHSLDIYDTWGDYFGNGIPTNAHSYAMGTDIPFMIYPTLKYQEKYPETTNRIISATDNEIHTEDFIYLLMDLLGVEASTLKH